ncbi:MAG: hypothetical protein IKY10_03670 [Clostridia bacterium]|nr:hypothetical protein [Clostridia bacterium]
MENINYENAKYSLALIDFRQYVEVLLNLEKTLHEADFIYNYVMKKAEQTADDIVMLRRFSFTEYAKVQQYLKKVKKTILKYQTELNEFLNENEDKQQEFNKHLDELIPLVEQYEKEIDSKIQGCFKSFQNGQVEIGI